MPLNTVGGSLEGHEIATLVVGSDVEDSEALLERTAEDD